MNGSSGQSTCKLARSCLINDRCFVQAIQALLLVRKATLFFSLNLVCACQPEKIISLRQLIGRNPEVKTFGPSRRRTSRSRHTCAITVSQLLQFHAHNHKRIVSCTDIPPSRQTVRRGAVCHGGSSSLAHATLCGRNGGAN